MSLRKKNRDERRGGSNCERRKIKIRTEFQGKLPKFFFGALRQMNFLFI